MAAARGDDSTKLPKAEWVRVLKRTGAAAREPLRRDRPGGLTARRLRSPLAAAPVL
jgi:hypothetical protein